MPRREHRRGAAGAAPGRSRVVLDEVERSRWDEEPAALREGELGVSATTSRRG